VQKKIQLHFILKVWFALFACIFFSSANAATPPPKVHHLAPAHWYVGFKDPTLEILIHAENIDLYDMQMEEAEGVQFLGKTNSGNRHIAYLNLQISPDAKPVNLIFVCKPSIFRPRYAKAFKFVYELRARTPVLRSSLNENDILYRVILDRFSNGDENNDNHHPGSRTSVDRNDPEARHGGDLKGFHSHLDYIKSLGITAVWFTPVQENNHPEKSYLGFSISDHFNVDPRLGNNDQFQKLTAECRKKNLKSIMDINPNDFSMNHWLYSSFDTGWFNQWDTFIHPDFTSYSINDPYYSPGDRMRAITGWIDINSPDVNQENAHMQKYLDQVYIWWLEYSGISGYCINRVSLFSDTYLAHLSKILEEEFPGVSIITDTKTNSIAAQASMVKNNITGFENNRLQSIPDYYLHYVFRNMMSKDLHLTYSVSSLYTALSDDILYDNPSLNLTFLDNSLEKRVVDQCGNDVNRWKMVYAYLFTLRGIPVIYYGSEIMLSSDLPGSMPAQSDFPGGWKSDSKNKFLLTGRSKEEQIGYDYLTKLMKIRLANPILTNGKMMQYPVEKGIYVFFRYDEKNSIMVITNTEKENQSVTFSRFQERLGGYSTAVNLLDNSEVELNSSMEIAGGSFLILKLR